MLKNNKSSKVLLCLLLSSLMVVVIVFTETSTISKASTIGGQAIINEGMNHLGKPYVWAGKGPNVFDCSGFTSYVYRKVVGLEIGSNTYSQINYPGKEISRSELQSGDLVFTHPGHVGIYIGNNQIIHAPGTGKVISISNVNKFWRARRILIQSPTIEELLFSAKVYLDKYPDLGQSFGHDEAQLHNHFITYGIDEGRSASELFDVKYYLANSPDLVQAFGATNYRAAYNHFINGGYSEGRELSPIFNLGYYAKNNPDLINAYGENYYEIMNHFKTKGMNEGRVGNENFNIVIYKNKYPDLVNIFGSDNKAYFNHYLVNGINEGRIGR